MNLTRIIDIKERIAVSDAFAPDERDFILDAINHAIRAEGPQMVRVAAAPNTLGRLDHIWVFLSVDDGGEGIMAAPMQDGMLSVPMVTANKRLLDRLIPMARELTKLFNKPIRLVKFKTREDVEIYQP